jgi:hypothetical protein
MSGPDSTSEARTDPVLSVTRGNPTDEELAAVVAVLLSQPAPPEPAVAPASGWSAYWRSVRAPVQPGPGAWRMSSRV